VNQQAITKAHLEIYRQLVRDRIEKNKEKALWSKLGVEWNKIAAEAGAVIAESQAGTPMPSFKRIAAVELVKLGNTVDAKAVIETVLSMYLLQDAEPKAIKSDIAFLTQMVRRVRGLTRLNAKVWTGASGRKKTAYNELGPKVVHVLGMKLAETFGTVGLTLAKLERQDHERRFNESTKFREALRDIE
jgi:hypothetical protein